jgi:hypothetical protein
LSAQDPVFQLTGTVRDTQSHDLLPNANIRVIGTTRGTTSNSEGCYRILLSSGEHTLVFSFLGYQSDTVRVKISDHDVQRDVMLRPSPILLPEVVVVGEVRDPAEEIIRRAIAKKRATLSQLHTYEFTAYTKMSSLINTNRSDQPDTSRAAFLVETSTQGYWKAPNYYKEVIVARKQPAIFPAELNLVSARNLPNLNDDRIILYNKKIVGPTAADAFDYYAYRMLDTMAVNNVIVWRIKMTPRSNVVPLFDGTISIADSSFLVMEVDVRGNDPLNEPPFTEIHLRQQFALYEDRFWLPIQSVISFTVQLGLIEIRQKETGRSVPLRLVQTSVISDYKINTNLSTSDFDQFSVRVLPTADRVDSLTWSRLQAIPLTAEETRSYQFWDSVMAAKSWRRDLALFLLRAPFEYRRLPITSFSDFYRFNRVEGSALGIGLDSKDYLAPTRLTLRSSYGFADREFRYAVGIEQHVSDNRSWTVGGEVYRSLKTIGGRSGLSPLGVTFAALFRKEDPLDYYDARGWSLYARGRILSDLVAEARTIDEQHRSVQKNTDFSLFKRSEAFRHNPSIGEGKLRSANLSLHYDTRKYIDAGFFTFPDETQESWMLGLAAEIAGKRFFGGDFEFVRVSAQLQRRQFTFGTGTVAILANLRWSAGSLPLQRNFISPARTREIGTSGALRTVGAEGIKGNRLASLQAEHDFGSMVFRSLGIELLNNLHFKLYIGSAWSDDSNQSGNNTLLGGLVAKRVFYEAGFGLSMVAPIPLALDFTWRLTHRDGNNFAVTFGSALF